MNMKQYILIGLSLLLAFPLNVAAQDETEEAAEVSVSKFTVKKKQYETRVIKGIVKDATTKTPISGALVRADGVEGYSVLTEDDGTYQLNVPVFSSEVVVSTPDYNIVRLGLQGGENQKPVYLYPVTFSGDYQTSTNIRNENVASGFQYSNAINIKEEVQKQLGAQVHSVMRNGTPGVGGVMFMQGLSSLNLNSQPLIVIDGVIIEQQYSRELLHDGFYNDILTNLNPADIEKVTVLRNGTALYGAKGGNGVILIDTRRNKSMATRITASLSAGVTFEPKYLSMMNASQYRGYASEMLKTTDTKLTSFRFLTEDPSNYYYTPFHQETDWKELVYRTAYTQNYGINIEGGDEVANYNLSVGYTKAQSTLKENAMDRLNIRFNTDIFLTKNLNVRFDASFSNQTRNLRNDGAPEGYDEGTPTSPSFLAYVKSPFSSPYTYARGHMSSEHLDVADETYLEEAMVLYPRYNWRLSNPAAILEYGEGDIKNRFENSMLNLTITPKYKISPELFVSEHFSYNLVNTSEKFYVPVNGVPDYFVTSVNANRENEVRSLASKQNSVMSDTRIDWTHRFDAHQLHLFGGARINWESYSMNSQLGYNTGNDKTPFMHAGLLNASDEGVNDNWNSLAWYAQAEYNYLNRYFLQANVTVEGSSRFGKEAGGLKLGGVSWGVFPGVQASWVVTNEPWMAGVPVLDYLRLTAGYDISGNDDIDIYATQSYFRAKQFLHTISSLAFEGIGSNKIKWETVHKFNAGFETHFLNNRVALNFNYFTSTTKDLLMKRSIGFLSGIKDTWVNGGELENKGFDVSATVKLLALKDWQWQVGASVGHYKNKVKSLAAGVESIENEVYGATIRTEVGQAANLFYGYKTAGVFSTTADVMAAGKDGEALYIMSENGRDKLYFQAGDMHFEDLNGDGQISEADRTVIGDPNPDIYGNIFTSLAWKRFKLDVNFNYSLGNDVYNYMRSQLESGSRFMNQTSAMNRRWQVEGQVTDVPRISFQDPMGNSRFSDRWIEDGSYLRLKSVTLSYDLPLKSEFIQGLQFWIQGNNLLTFTKYLGSDPEFSMTTSVIGQGIDLGQLPMSRSLVAGVKINL